MASQKPQDPFNTDRSQSGEKVPEPGRIVARRVGPVGWFVVGLTALAFIVLMLMILR